MSQVSAGPLSSWSRRRLLRWAASVTSAQALGGAARRSAPRVPVGGPNASIDAASRTFLEDVQKRAAQYFWQCADHQTGIVLDRAPFDGLPAQRDVGSTAATGFALATLAIAAQHGWVPREQVRARVLATLRWHWRHAFHDHGFFYHFMDVKSGGPRLQSEISTVDTALFLCGMLTAAGYFHGDREIAALANQIFERVDFAWMLNGHPMLLAHGTRPGAGFLRARWDSYSEASVLYLLAIGSPHHAIPAESWYGWHRPEVHFEKWKFVSGGPLFTHQFSHAFVDFRHQRDGYPFYIDYFENSVIATYAHRDFCLSLREQHGDFGPDMWGVTASDSPVGYVAWGGPPYDGPIDGTLVPCAAAGSLMFAHQICLPVLREMYGQFGTRIYGPFGFTDAFHPTGADGKLWVNPDVLGIDLGITALSIENLLTGNVWRWFMRNQYITAAMERVAFRLQTPGTIGVRERVAGHQPV